MGTSRYPHRPPPDSPLGGLCAICGHAVAAHGHDCTICVLLEDMAAALLGLEECGICLALVRPESKADHERWHSTTTNLPMTQQRARWSPISAAARRQS